MRPISSSTDNGPSIDPTRRGSFDLFNVACSKERPVMCPTWAYIWRLAGIGGSCNSKVTARKSQLLNHVQIRGVAGSACFQLCGRFCSSWVLLAFCCSWVAAPWQRSRRSELAPKLRCSQGRSWVSAWSMALGLVIFTLCMTWIFAETLRQAGAQSGRVGRVGQAAGRVPLL